MTAPHDSREAVEAMAAMIDFVGGSIAPDGTTDRPAAMLRRLLARAEAAEQERDQWIANSRENKLIAESNLRERDAADATGYARGVKDAAGLFNVKDWPAYGYLMQHTILALLPDATKETRDE